MKAIEIGNKFEVSICAIDQDGNKRPLIDGKITLERGGVVNDITVKGGEASKAISLLMLTSAARAIVEDSKDCDCEKCRDKDCPARDDSQHKGPMH